MDGPTILGAIRLFVALLFVAVIVAIVARPIRLPYSVALVLVGLLAGVVATLIGFGQPPKIAPEIVLAVLLPGLVFEAAYRLEVGHLRRSAGSLAVLAVPGVVISATVVALFLHLATGLRLDLAFIVGAMVSATDPVAVVSTFKRLQVPPALATVVEGESLLNDGTGLVIFAIALQALASPGRAGRGGGHVRGDDRDQRRDRARHRVPGRAPDVARRRPPDRADHLAGAGLRDLSADRRGPRLGHHRDRRGRRGPGQLRAPADDQRARHRRTRHGLGVPGLPPDGDRLPAGRPGHPAGPAARFGGLDRLGRGRRAGRSSHRRLRHAPARRSLAAAHGQPGRAAVGLVPRPVLVGPARSRRGGRRAGPAGRRPAAGPAPGGDLRDRPVHPARPGTHRRAWSSAGP